jgi:hypothetical protein
MRPITEEHAVQHYKSLAAEMMLGEEHEECEFRPDWIRRRGWTVVPVEDGNHFRPWEVDRIVRTLNDAGYSECIALATEPLDPFPACFQLAINREDFNVFNDECGLFRFMLMEETRSWAISCNEIYNLFAGRRSFVESMVGAPIEEAQRRFLAFAEGLSRGNHDYPPLRAARLYASFPA